MRSKQRQSQDELMDRVAELEVINAQIQNKLNATQVRNSAVAVFLIDKAGHAIAFCPHVVAWSVSICSIIVA